MQRLIFYICLLLFLCTNCKTDCTNLGSFNSYYIAEQVIRSSDFAMKSTCSMASSSWLQKAEYYSCDEKTGYLIVFTKKGKSYLYENVPVGIWKDFKTTDSFGRFYNSELKGKYGFRLK